FRRVLFRSSNRSTAAAEQATTSERKRHGNGSRHEREELETVKRRLLIGTAATALAVAATLLGGAFRSGDAASLRGAPPLAGDRLESGFAAGDTQTLIERLQAAVRSIRQDGM